MLPNTMLPKQNYALMESKVYAEKNGQVIEDKYIKETIENDKMEVEGYDNGQPIYYVKDLSKSPSMKPKSSLSKSKSRSSLSKTQSTKPRSSKSRAKKNKRTMKRVKPVKGKRK
jgi:hypothetical protein